MEILQPIFDNFFKFDFLIIILAIVTLFIYGRCLRVSKELHSVLQPSGSLALGEASKEAINHHFDFYLDDQGEAELLLQRQKMNQWYVIFLNIVAVFPLMGLLGTVVSLIPMVGSLQTGLFFMALTSTFWGIVFAIIFKLLNSYLQALVEDNLEMVQTYLLRRDALLVQNIQGQDNE